MRINWSINLAEVAMILFLWWAIQSHHVVIHIDATATQGGE